MNFQKCFSKGQLLKCPKLLEKNQVICTLCCLMLDSGCWSWSIHDFHVCFYIRTLPRRVRWPYVCHSHYPSETWTHQGHFKYSAFCRLSYVKHHLKFMYTGAGGEGGGGCSSASSSFSSVDAGTALTGVDISEDRHSDHWPFFSASLGIPCSACHCWHSLALLVNISSASAKHY